jgi:hypothetical protein
MEVVSKLIVALLDLDPAPSQSSDTFETNPTDSPSFLWSSTENSYCEDLLLRVFGSCHQSFGHGDEKAW